MGQGGFRLDWLPANGDMITFQSDGYGGTFEQPAPGDTTVDGQNVLARWTRPLGEGSDLTVQTYWDRTYRASQPTFTESLNTYDIDLQHRFALGQRQSVVWGGGYRLMADQVRSGTTLLITPPDRNLQLFSGFVQDEIQFIPDRLHVTLGAKFEHNDFSGFEVQPSGRIAWTPDTRQTLWAAISRAVRTPSRVDRGLVFSRGPPYLIAGGRNFESEKLDAYELDIGCGLGKSFIVAGEFFIINMTTSAALERTHSRSKTETAPRKQVSNFQPIIRRRAGGGCAGDTPSSPSTRI